MRVILLSFLLLFNYSSHVTSCPSSGDGDCVPSKDTYNKNSNQKSIETSDDNISSSFDNYESDGGLPEDHVAKPSS